MATIAELLIKVDASQVSKATESLKKFEGVSGNIGKSADNISKGMDGASKSSEEFNTNTDKLIAKAKEMAATVGQGSVGVLEYRAALAGVSLEVREYADKTRELVESQKNQAAIDKEILRSKQKYSEEQYRFSQSLKEEMMLYGKSKEEVKGLTAARLGLSEQYELYLDYMRRHKELAEMLKNTEGSSVEESSRNIAETIKANEKEIAQKEEIIRSERERIDVAREGADEARRHLAAHKERVKELSSENVTLRSVIKSNSDLASSEREVTKTTSQVKEEASKTREEFKKLKYAVDPASKSLDILKERAKQAEIALNKARDGVGGLSVEETTRVFNKANSDLQHFQKMSDTTGKTVKELNFAMRGLPAQFTDIAVSLQGGQRPLTVFLQQGGQLKDMFGGIGPAAKAMGSYVMTLITPLNLIIAALGGIGFAVYSGSKDMETMNKMIIQSGKLATLSSSDILNYSSEVANMSHTVGQSIEAISLFVNEMELSDETLINASAAALSWSKITGDSLDEVVKDFSKLSKDPVKSIVGLDSKYKFLTASIYNSVRALQEAGREMEATELATNALAQSISDKSELMYERLGLIAKGWYNVKSAATGVFDYFADMGRGNDEELLGVLEERLNKATEARDRLMQPTGGDMPVNQYLIEKQNEIIEDATNKINALKRETEISEGQGLKDATVALGTAMDNSRTKLEKATLAIVAFKSATKEGSLFDEEDLANYKKELAALERVESEAMDEMKGLNLLKAQRKITEELKYQVAHGKSMGAQQKAYNDLVKELDVISARVREGNATESELAKHNAREGLLAGAKENMQLEKQIELQKESNKQAKANRRVKVEASEKMLQGLAAQEERLREQLLSNTRIGREEGKLHSMRRRFEEIELQGKSRALTLDEKSLLASRDELLAEQLKNVQLEKSIRLKQQAEKLSEMSDDYTQRGIESGDRSKELLESQGRGDKSNEIQRERNSLIKEEAKLLLEAKRNSQGDDNYYKQQAAIIEDHFTLRREQLESYYQLEDELQKDWLAGMSAGFETFIENQGMLYDSMKGLTEGIMTTLQDGITDSLYQAIWSSESLGDTLSNLAMVVREQLVKGLIDMGVQFAITAAKEIALTKMVGMVKRTEIATTAAAANAATVSTGAVQATTAATTAAAWSPAALAASVGSFGSAAFVGLAALIAITAAFKGFRKGGYTGGGGVDDVAGVVHGQEFVFDAESTARIGVDNLERIRSGEKVDLDSSGLPSNGGGGNSLSGNSGTTSLTINLIESEEKAGRVDDSQMESEGIIDIFVSDIMGDGRSASAIQSRFGLSPSGY